MILAAILGAFSLLFIVGNVLTVVHTVITKKSASMIPFLGGVLGAAALWQAGELKWAWVPPVVDIGSVPMLVLLGVAALKPEKKPEP